MTVALRAAGITAALAMTLAACAGGDQSDEDAIESMANEFLDAFADEDVDRVLGMFSETCGDLEEAAVRAFEEFPGGESNWEFEIERVEFGSLTSEAAEIRAVGSVTIDGEERAFDDEEFAPLVKEGGEWKRADCDFFDQ